MVGLCSLKVQQTIWNKGEPYIRLMNVGAAILGNGRGGRPSVSQYARKSKYLSRFKHGVYLSWALILFDDLFISIRYAPFDFKKSYDKNGKVLIEVERMYGCICHSKIREKVIRKHGERKGWEPFGQWSIKKARILAKRLADRYTKSNEDSSSYDCDEADNMSSHSSADELKLCHNGICIWKYKHKYDDIFEEIERKCSSDK